MGKSLRIFKKMSVHLKIDPLTVRPNFFTTCQKIMSINSNVHFMRFFKIKFDLLAQIIQHRFVLCSGAGKELYGRFG